MQSILKKMTKQVRSVFVDTSKRQKREKENFKSDIKTAIPKKLQPPDFREAGPRAPKVDSEG